MHLFIPRSLCALKRVAARAEHHRYGATQGIRIAVSPGLYRAEVCDGYRAMVVQGLIPDYEPPWPGFKEVPDDACETIILPKDLERACKLGDYVQGRSDTIGMATVGNEIYLGLGSDLINTRSVEGKFPKLEHVIPKKRPVCTFRVDPKPLAEALLAMADLLPDGARAVQVFYYGDGIPLGFCARNVESGMMIDALVVTIPKPEAEKKPATQAENGQTAPEGAEDAEPRSKTKRRGKKPKAGETPADPTPPEAVPEQANVQEMYRQVKERHTGMLVLFRVGDSYEAFQDDAEIVAKVLDLRPTSRDEIAMVGFPHQSLEPHLRTLLQAGHRVAICDQVEDVEGREVTRIVTPGTITEENPEQPQESESGTLPPNEYIRNASDEALLNREYELRQILDQDKTPEQLEEMRWVLAEIRRRAAAETVPVDEPAAAEPNGKPRKKARRAKS